MMIVHIINIKGVKEAVAVVQSPVKLGTKCREAAVVIAPISVGVNNLKLVGVNYIID